jgi:NADPH2 dehydrogenase
MARLFEPIALGDLTLANRIVVSPMCQYSAEDGTAGDWHLAHLGQLALGGAGLLFFEATHVSAEGRITPGCLGLYSDANQAALARVVAHCRRYGDARLGLQLGHAGRRGSAMPPWRSGRALAPSEGAWTTLSPSALPYGPDWPAPQALDEAGLDKIKRDFVAATLRALAIGFDLIELHLAHGYLLHQFLSPLSNQRNDAYGGSSANRQRFPLEVFRAVRAAWPKGRPLGVRVSATDWIEGGWTVDETAQLARTLAGEGCDFIDVSTGGLDPRQKITLGPGYQVPFAERIRTESKLPTMAVGLIADPHHAERIIAAGQADMVAMARAMLDDPRWAWHAAETLGAKLAYPDQYARAHPALWPRRGG